MNNTLIMTSIQDSPVGLYTSVRDTFGTEISLREYLNQTAPSYLQGEAKKSLACITVGGVFASRRTDSILKPSGIVQVDIDAKSNDHVRDWEQVKLAASMVDGMELVTAISASGEGVFGLYFDPLLLAIFEDRGAAAYLDAHKAMTASVTEAVEELTGCVADRSVINRPNGLRFITADSAPIVLVEEPESSGVF